jgi:orotate phosphoribosyltransferase
MTLLELLKEKAFQKKQVVLASGRSSNFYIDVKRLSLDPQGAFLIGNELFKLISENFSDVRAVGGLTLGADPLATAVSISSWVAQRPLSAFIVRKEAKTHGMTRLIEGSDLIPLGSRVVILEDVVTSGKSSLEAAQKAREFGWEVLGVAAVVDRQEGGRESLEAHNLVLKSLYCKSDFGIIE